MSESDIVKDFLIESHENLDRLDRELVELEKNPANKGALASIFRTIHTIKGTCGFLRFNKLEKLTHVGENLLSRLRDGALTLTPEITTALLDTVDAVRQMLEHIERDGSEGERNDGPLIDTLTTLQQVPATQASEQTRPSIGEILMERAGVSQEVILQAAEKQKKGDPRHLGEILVEQKAVRASDVVEALRIQQSSRASGGVLDSSVRVDVHLLDKLMNLVGELVLARNQVLQYGNKIKERNFMAASQRLNLITTELQEGVMKTRMQPIGNIWGQFPRTVRDVALACGKQVVIEMEGKETELDKTIIEAIKDPLTHLVRNSVDHGIESPEARARAGKDATGRVMLRASHEGGQVHIEICDDGAGLDSERIRQKALGKGLVSAEQAIRMTDRDIVNLIFMPGFSTAEKVSKVSGRGVGMDVVRTNIEKIGGTVDVQSRPGLGTTVHMRIPLTLAIIPALIVTGGSERYAIPQVCLLELVHLEAEQAASRIERVHGALVHRLRGRLLSLVFLEQALGAEQSRAADRKGAVNIVVLQANDQQFGLVVDEIKDTEEIVVKPLGRQLKGVSAFAGATIMGDGKVALILDPVGLAQRARVIGGAAQRIVKEQERTAEEKAGGNRQTLLLFQIGQSGRMAVPLSLVARLEEFPRSAVERSGSQEVVQYRGRIMPLVNISAAVEVSELAEEGAGSPAHSPLQVLVHSDSGRSVGLVVDRILDIVEQEILVEKVGQRRGVLGSAVVQKRVTDLLDIHELLRLTQPGFARAAAAGD